MEPNFPPRGLTKGSLVRLKVRYVFPPDVGTEQDYDESADIGVVVIGPRLESRFKSDFLDRCLRSEEGGPTTSGYTYMTKVHWASTNTMSWHNVNDLDVLRIC